MDAEDLVKRILAEDSYAMIKKDIAEDQVELLRSDNVVSEAAKAAGLSAKKMQADFDTLNFNKFRKGLLHRPFF